MIDEFNAFELCPGCFGETVRRGICSGCGYDREAAQHAIFLETGTLLENKFVIGKPLGKPGGFGVVYLAYDRDLAIKVAIKEYLPQQWASRQAGRATISPLSKEEEPYFRYGLEKFLEEARTLARFRHANVVRINHFFHALGTGYLVMDYYEGVTLDAHVKAGRLPEREAVGLMLRLLDGLAAVHAGGMLHRDIKPQNIYLAHGEQESMPILLDFGEARQAMMEQSGGLTVILTHGFAPPEQYEAKRDQGPWTDIYACGATLYYMVTGKAPPDALSRARKDTLETPQTLARHLSPELDRAIMWALSLGPGCRPDSVAPWRDALAACLIERAKPPEEKLLVDTMAALDDTVTVPVRDEPATLKTVRANPSLYNIHLLYY